MKEYETGMDPAVHAGKCPDLKLADVDMNKLDGKSFHAILLHQDFAEQGMKCIEHKFTKYSTKNDTLY
jgi:hypothetical protein